MNAESFKPCSPVFFKAGKGKKKEESYALEFFFEEGKKRKENKVCFQILFKEGKEKKRKEIEGK